MTASAEAPAREASPRPTDDTSGPSGALVGLGRLLRFAMRRDRVRMPVWVLSVVGVVTASSASVVGLYATDADLKSYASVTRADAAFKAITGPGFGLDDPTQGAVVMNEMEMFTFIGIALMCVFMLVRHTRADEESDRADLVRAAPVGRHAVLAAGCIWVVAIDVVIAVGLLLGLHTLGLPFAGSAAFAAAAGAIGIFFVGVTAVTAQVAEGARSARAMAGIALGASFVLRAVGDLGKGWLTWLSPLGWAQAIRAYADERWWVLALLLVSAGLLAGVGWALSSHRDLGAGILPQRPGRSRASPRLATPLALAARLQRGSVLGWVVGVGLTGFFFGLVAEQADELASNEAVADILAQAGQGSLTDSFLATSMLMMALIVTGFTVSSVLRLRSEESDLRAEPVLATPVSRRRWASSHLTVAVAGSGIVMTVAGLLTGLGYGIETGDAGRILPLIGAGLAQLTALLVLAGLTMALIGIRPQWAVAAWGVVAFVAVVGLLGESLNLPQWIQDLSPFEHVPALPAATFEPVPVLVLITITVGLVAGAMAGITRRDIG